MDFYEWRERRGESADPESEQIATLAIGAIIEVHKHLGPGHPESAYLNALCHEFDLRGIPYRREVPIDVIYKGTLVGKGRIDLLVGETVIVELKSVETLTELHRGQVVSYLTAAKLRLGLLANFNVVRMKEGIKRVVRDPKSAPS